MAAALAAVAVDGLSEHELVEAAAGWQQLASWAQAKQAEALAELTRRKRMCPARTKYRSVNPVTNAAMDLAGRLRITARQAENLVGHAVQLRADFSATWQALRAGVIDERRARVITTELGGCAPAIRARAEAAALSQAPELDATGLRRVVKRLAHAADPAEAERRCQQARRRRYVCVSPASDGMAYLEAYLPAEDAHAIKVALDSAAAADKLRDRRSGRAARTADQRRADALAQLGWSTLAAGQAPTSPGLRLAREGGRPVTVHVTMPLTTLTGADSQPAELDGYGPIPASVARQLATAGVWEWLGTHPATGQVLDYGLTRYRPTRALADFIVRRDRTCRGPGCHRQAYQCEIDHRVPYADGGPTSADNCLPLCKTHHLLKHHGGWRLEADGTGGYVWHSPSGHRYRKPPEPVRPIGQCLAPPDDESSGQPPDQPGDPPPERPTHVPEEPPF
jgi:hypothetical protein